MSRTETGLPKCVSDPTIEANHRIANEMAILAAALQKQALGHGDAAMHACYAERAKAQPFFAALVKQAQELVERTK